MDKKILHICDSSLFIKWAIDLFEEALPGKNVFLFNSNLDRYPNINVTKYDFVYVKDFTNGDYLDFVRGVEKDYFLVIFHNIGIQYKRDIIDLFYGRVPMHGILWGWEIYDDFKLTRFLYEKKTYSYLKKVKSLNLSKSTYVKIKNELKILIYGKKWLNPNIAFVEKLNSFSTILKVEYSFLRNRYGISTRHFLFNYSGGYNFDLSCANVVGDNIMVGNSTNPTNNHLDIMPILKRTSISDNSKIILPLSTGNMGYKKYANEVQSEFVKIFREKVVALKELLNFNDFNKIVNSCGFVILNHKRQQAMGSVFLSLWNGSKLFLNKRSMGYKELLESGIKIYKLEDFKHEYPIREDKEVVLRNRNAILNIRGRNRSLENVKKIVINYLSK